MHKTIDPYIAEKQAQGRRIKDATQRILEISAELHLTWREFELAVDCVKRDGYISLSPCNKQEKPS